MKVYDFSEFKQLQNRSLESVCYQKDNKLYKIFNQEINTDRREEIIKIFINNNIDGCPKVYDFVYDFNNKLIGYVMEYYKDLIPLSKEKRFNVLKHKLIELIYIYLKLKKEYGICYFDFHSNNVFLNNNNILLLDIDSCIKNTSKINEISDKLLIEFILSTLYKINYFEISVYFKKDEINYIHDSLYNYKNIEIDSISSLEDFLNVVTKKDIKKILTKIPYKF